VDCTILKNSGEIHERIMPLH